MAVNRAEVIGRLAEMERISAASADQAAARLGLKRRQVYELGEALAGWCGFGVISSRASPAAAGR
ncbi:hypothetical protein ABZW96_33055 [Nocardia sp. NPDC004168]|uniref:hypothetical protein n=1 Tax=Nocardia sp. NPDC004168 TaxID=3154452 RepID=UPI0033BEF431